jgi:hypothetical protein
LPFLRCSIAGFLPPQSATRHELVGKSGDDFEEHRHRCDRYGSRGKPVHCRGRGCSRSRCWRQGATLRRGAVSNSKAALLRVWPLGGV